MLRKRIIFTLIYSDGFFNQSRNFRLQKVGNIDWLEKHYKFQNLSFSLDELIVLNASRENKTIEQFSVVLNRLVDDVFIPIAAGGGIRTMQDAEILFANGADKIVINTALYKNKGFIKELIKHYGSQSIIGSIDYKAVDNELRVFIENGSEELPFTLLEYIQSIEDLKVGELYLNSIDMDGTGFGYDIDTINLVSDFISIPIILAGGAGNAKHFIGGLEINSISAVATANLFNFIGDGLPKARENTLKRGLNLAQWKK